MSPPAGSLPWTCPIFLCVPLHIPWCDTLYHNEPLQWNLSLLEWAIHEIGDCVLLIFVWCGWCLLLNRYRLLSAYYVPRHFCNAHSISQLSHKVGNIVLISHMEKNLLELRGLPKFPQRVSGSAEIWIPNPFAPPTSPVVFFQSLMSSIPLRIWSSRALMAPSPLGSGASGSTKPCSQGFLGEKDSKEVKGIFEELTNPWGDGSDTSREASRTKAIHHELFKIYCMPAWHA